ncbi:MAG: hypothetical protein MUF77_11930 [Leptospira sp.]|nr:hypothetical protein [Leptospira sp.]
MIERAFTGASGLYPNIDWNLYALIGILFFVDIMQNQKEDRFEFLTENPYILYPFCIIMYIVAFIVYSVTVSSPFLYFQF